MTGPNAAAWARNFSTEFRHRDFPSVSTLTRYFESMIAAARAHKVEPQTYQEQKDLRFNKEDSQTQAEYIPDSAWDNVKVEVVW